MELACTGSGQPLAVDPHEKLESATVGVLANSATQGPLPTHGVSCYTFTSTPREEGSSCVRGRLLQRHDLLVGLEISKNIVLFRGLDG